MACNAKSFNINLLSEENIKKYVLPKYNLENSNLEQIKFKNTDKQRAVYKVTTSDSTYCLKKVYFDKKELLYVYSAVEWLYRYNIKVPRILPSYNNNRFVEFNNMLFILTPWIQGNKCDYDNFEHIFYSIENLANMHNCYKNFVPIKGAYRGEKFSSIHTSFEKHFYDLLKCSNLAFKYKDKFSKLYIDNFDDNISLAYISMNTSKTINNQNLSRNLCHLDYVNKNIIIDDNDKIWVIDFDKCNIDYKVHDISYFFRRLLRRSKTLWDYELTIDTLNYYTKHSPLNLDEYKYIFSYLCFPQKFWKISRDYYNNINKCNKNSFIKILQNSTKNSQKHLEFAHRFNDYLETKFNEKIIN